MRRSFKLKTNIKPVFLGMEIHPTSVWSHCLSRHSTASRTLSLLSSTIIPLTARETCGLVGEAMTPGVSNNFRWFEMFTSCMDLREGDSSAWLKRPQKILKVKKAECLSDSLCDASLETCRADRAALQTVDDTAFPNIRKTWEWKASKNSF